MRRRSGAASAALTLAAALWIAPLLADRALPAVCAQPGEAAARAGHTLEVVCTGGARLRGPARLLFGRALDLNRADAASLQVLPGIGPVRAAAIVAERERRPFDSVGSLTRVRGIGPRTLARLRPSLEVSEAVPGAGPG